MNKLLIIPCCFLFLCSCVDDAYDKDIDMNVTLLENGVSIPIGVSEKFTLSKIIDEDDNLKIDGDNVYYISETTSASANYNAMNSILIEQQNGLVPDLAPTSITIGDEVTEALALAKAYGLSIDQEVEIPLELDLSAPIDPSDLNISEYIQRIDTVVFDEPITTTLTFTTELFDNQGGSEVSLQLTDLKIEFPRMLMFSTSGDYGDAVLEDTDDDGNNLVVTDHILTIPNKNAENGVFSVSLEVYGLYGGEIQEDGTNDLLITKLSSDKSQLDILNNEFSLKGDAVLQVNLKDVNTTFKDEAQLLTYYAIDEIEIVRISGIVDAYAEEPFTIELGSMPDFLDEYDISLDLYNPYIRLNAVNPIEVPIFASLTIDPRNEKGESLNETPVVVDTIHINKAEYDPTNNVAVPSQVNIFISPVEPTDDWVDAEAKTFMFNDTLYTWVYSNLPDLLNSKIPTTLEVNVSVQTDTSTGHMAILDNKKVEINVACDITVPLEFGEDFSIHYTDIQGDLDDIFTDFTVGEATIIVGYETTLPVDVEFSIDALSQITYSEYQTLSDSEKVSYEKETDDGDVTEYFKIIKDVNVEILDADMNGNGKVAGVSDEGADPTPSTGQIVIQLTEDEKYALQALTHIQYHVVADLAESLKSGALRSTQYLQLTMTAEVADISVDLDSL